MDYATLSRQFLWLKDNGNKLKVIDEALRLLIDPYSISILKILVNGGKKTCSDILLSKSPIELEETKVYRFLEMLEKLDFISAETKTTRYEFPTRDKNRRNVVYSMDERHEQLFTLNVEAVGRFVECLNSSGLENDWVIRTDASSILKVRVVRATSDVECIMNFDFLRSISKAISCLRSLKKVKLLNTLSSSEDVMTDKELSSEESGVQSTIYRNLKRLTEAKLILRETGKGGIRESRMNAGPCSKIISFVQDVSYMSFDHEVNPRRPVVLWGLHVERREK